MTTLPLGRLIVLASRREALRSSLAQSANDAADISRASLVQPMQEGYDALGLSPTAQSRRHDFLYSSILRHEDDRQVLAREYGRRAQRMLHRNFSSGGALSLTLFGYIKSADARTDDQLQKDFALQPVILELFRRLEYGDRYTVLANWLNVIGVRPGLYCRKSSWDGGMVSRFVHQPLLKGVRFRRITCSNREWDATRVQIRTCPHLAFFPADYYDRVIAAADRRNHRRERVERA